MTQARRQLVILIAGLLVAAGVLFGIRAQGQAEHDRKIDRMAEDFSNP